VALGAYDHQELPFEKLVEELKPERDLSRTPLFQVFLNMVNVPAARVELPGLTMERLPSPDVEAKFELTLYLRERGGELWLELVYNADLFDRVRMVEMLQQLNCLLAQIVENPQSTIGSYSLVTPQARSLLPDPEVAVPEPTYEPVTTTFLSWAERAPQQPAVIQGEQTWSYGELAASSHALARYLLAQGIERGDVVALLGPRSFGLIAGMMSVLSSRGVFLTVDRNLPISRQRLMLQKAGAKHVLFIGERRPEDEWLQELPSLAITSVDSNTGRVIEQQGVTDQETIDLPELTPDDPAYIFFTSGTTGTPKGILGSHKGLSHFLAWQRESFAVGPQDRCAQLTSLTFDPLLRDIFLPLTSGATLCLSEEDSVLSADQVIPWLERERVSLLHTVPALAQSWLSHLPAGISLRALRYVFFAGEPLSEALVRRWREAFPEASGIVNLYGPTETTMAKCFFRVPSSPLQGVQPVGWPLPQTQALVLSRNGRPCGIGEPGEIVIRTPFRTLGYIDSEREVGQQRFLRNPFRDDEGDLLYYSGDRGRYRTDGALEYLGRLDHQVKLRGVRVEPGEIQAVLSRHPAIRENVVVARDDMAGGAPTELKRLVAYIVPDHKHALLVSELRSYLRERLPEYMVPSSFVALEELPLTLNGKVDRRALPAPDPSSFRAETDFVGPRDALEGDLVGIWEEVLGVERVGVHDDFFELGGHSLRATRVVSWVREVFGVELPLLSLFEEPTVAGLAERIRVMQQSRSVSSTVALGSDNIEELRF
jgi:amino acid adenylation domain-containing protein